MSAGSRRLPAKLGVAALVLALAAFGLAAGSHNSVGPADESKPARRSGPRDPSDEPPRFTDHMDELTDQEAWDQDPSAHPGAGGMAVLGPNSFIAGEAGQEMYVRVFNFSGAPGTWTLSAEGPSLDGPWSCEVTITGSKGPRDLATQVVGIPLGQNPEAGDSHIDIEFTNADGVHGPRAEWVKVIDLAGWQRVIILAGARFGLIDDDPLAVEQLIWVLTRGDSSAPLDITAPRPASWLGASGPAYKGASLAITGIVAAGLLAFGSALRGRRRMAREVRMAGGDR